MQTGQTEIKEELTGWNDGLLQSFQRQVFFGAPKDAIEAGLLADDLLKRGLLRRQVSHRPLADEPELSRGQKSGDGPNTERLRHEVVIIDLQVFHFFLQHETEKFV